MNSEPSYQLKSLEVKPTQTKKWVKFEDDVKSDNNEVEKSTNVDTSQNIENTSNSAVLPTESIHVNVSHSRSTDLNISNHDMKVIDLRETSNGVSSKQQTNTIRQGFANGDVIVTLLPINSNFPWITPAKFRPELVPEELMAQGLTLTVEDYVHFMEMLTNDIRFTLYNICYKRVLVLWIFAAFVILLALLFSGVQGLTLFSLGVTWLIFNSAAIFLCMWIKIKLNHNLERCIAQVNRHFIRHKIILGLDDRGRISCHKVHLCFIYFDTKDCIKKLQEVIENEEIAERVGRELSQEDQKAKNRFRERMDIDDQDIIIQGSNPTRLSRKQDRGEQLFIRYIQRWSKDFLRHRLDWTKDEERANPTDTRHLSSALCPCQYIEEYLRCKSSVNRRTFCPSFSSFMKERGVN